MLCTGEKTITQRGVPFQVRVRFEWPQMQETVVDSVKWRRRGGKQAEDDGDEQVSLLGVGAEFLQGWNVRSSPRSATAYGVLLNMLPRDDCRSLW